MVIHRSNIYRTQAGRHPGVRRGLAAVALGALLAGSAGVPASHAAAGVLAPSATTGPLSLSFDGLSGGLFGNLPGSPQPTPSQQATSSEQPASREPTPTKPASPEPTPTKPASPSQQPEQDDDDSDDDGAAAPDRTAGPSPTQSRSAQPEAPRDAPQAEGPSTPQPAPPAADGPAAVQPGNDPAPGQEPSSAGQDAVEEPAPGAGTPPGTAGTLGSAGLGSVPAGPGPARTAAPAGAEGRSGSNSLKATSAEEDGPSPLLGWGICLVGLSVIAGVVVIRLHRV
jgi:hypothetical protein